MWNILYPQLPFLFWKESSYLKVTDLGNTTKILELDSAHVSIT